MQLFFDKKCDIYDVDIVKIEGEDTKSYTSIYTDIECDFYVPNNKFSKSNQARETEGENLEVVLPGDKTLVRKGYRAVLTDSIGIEYGSYVIDDVIVYRNINNIIDNIVLRVSQRNVG